jgi:hypothetical protein
MPRGFNSNKGDLLKEKAALWLYMYVLINLEKRRDKIKIFA